MNKRGIPKINPKNPESPGLLTFTFSILPQKCPPKPLRLLVITYYWPPSGGAGVQRSLKFVKYLPAFGVEPTVITVNASQGAYPVLDESLMAEVPAEVPVLRTNTSEPFDSYKKLTGRRQIPHGGFANKLSGVGRGAGQHRIEGVALGKKLGALAQHVLIPAPARIRNKQIAP